MYELKRGDVCPMTSCEIIFDGPNGPIRARYTADRKDRMVFMFMGGEARDGSKSLPTDKVLQLMGYVPLTDDIYEPLDALMKDLEKWEHDEEDAKTWGGPTIHPQHPIDPKRAREVTRVLKKLLGQEG